MSLYMNQNPLYSLYSIGDWTYGCPDVFSWGENALLTIGKFCSIAHQVGILLGGEHNMDWVTTYPFNSLFQGAGHLTGHPKTKGNVTIGNDVWIGFNAVILSGVTIGNGAVIAARSTVVKNIPSYAIAAGNPARIIRYRFSPAIINDLEHIAWWNWPIEQIAVAWPLLLSNRIDEFVHTYKS